MAHILPTPLSRKIPTAIAQQLSVYQLGEPLELYKAGISLLISLILVLGSLLLTVVGIIIAWSVSLSTGYLPLVLVMAPCLTLLLAYVFTYMLFQGETLLAAFDHALVYARNGKAIVVPWEQIALFQQETLHGVQNFVRRRYTFRTHQGQTFQVTGAPPQVDDFRRVISNKLRPYIASEHIS